MLDMGVHCTCVCMFERGHDEYLRVIYLIFDFSLTSTCENDFGENNNAIILWKEGGGCVKTLARITQARI